MSQTARDVRVKHRLSMIAEPLALRWAELGMRSRVMASSGCGCRVDNRQPAGSDSSCTR